jgi:hypothetical protein
MAAEVDGAFVKRPKQLGELCVKGLNAFLTSLMRNADFCAAISAARTCRFVKTVSRVGSLKITKA